MCFGNNPGCMCCQQLPVWDITKRFSINGAVTSNDEEEWPGKLVEGLVYNRFQAVGYAISYDVVYKHKDGLLSQFQASSSQTPNWTITAPAGAEIVSNTGISRKRISVGDHGLIDLSFDTSQGTVGKCYWLNKDSTYTYVSKTLANTNNLEVVGVGTFTITAGNYLILSGNSPYVAAFVLAAGTFYAAIGLLELVNVSGEYKIRVNPVQVFTNPDGQYTGSIGTGIDDVLYWSLRGGGTREIFLPGMTAPESLTKAMVNGGANASYYEFPGNITTGWYRYGSTNRWFTQHLDTNERIVDVDPGVYLLGGTKTIFAYPIASAFDVSVSYFIPGPKSLPELQAIFPDIADASILLDLRKYYISTDHAIAKFRARYNRQSLTQHVYETRGVIVADGVGAGSRVVLYVTRNGSSNLSGSVAEFTLTVREPPIFPNLGPKVGLLLDDSKNNPDADDFVVYTTGTVTYTSPMVLVVNSPSTYSVTVNGVNGGVDGGTITITVATPSELSTYLPNTLPEGLVLSGTPQVLERFTVPALP